MKKQAGETGLEDPLVEMPEGKHDYNLQTYVFSSWSYPLLALILSCILVM